MMSRLRTLALLLAALLFPVLLHAIPELRTRVYPADTPVVLRITARRGSDAGRFGKMVVEYIREDGGKNWERLPATVKEGVLLVPVTLRGEGGHTLRVGTLDERGKFIPAGSFELYSLHPDLFRERPWRGDSHLLSRVSGGRQQPPRIAALARRAGFDFIALTDRGRIEPSVTLAETVKQWRSGFTVLSGESWSLAGGLVTVIAVGHDGEIAPLPKGTPVVDASLDSDERAAAGAAAALAAEIRRRGGVAVFCHPAMRQNDRFLTPTALRRYLILHGGFDAIEMLNARSGVAGVSRVAALCREASGREGAPRALLGVSGFSDVARVSFGRVNTVVFAPENGAPAIIAALRRGRCVASLRIPGYSAFHGPSRLVDYALFLNRAYWPAHDRFCWKQGNALLGFIDGNSGLSSTVEKCAAELEGFRREFWYGGDSAGGNVVPAVRGDAASTSSPR